MSKFNIIHNEKIMVGFKGKLSAEIFEEIIKFLEENLKQTEPQRLTEKKVFYIVQEALQNTHNYIIHEPLLDEDHRIMELIVEKNGEKYHIKTSNYMLPEKVKSLSQHIDVINRLNTEELRTLYRQVLSEEGFSPAGGAGLGIIEIARKSGQKLKYTLKKVSEQYSLFNLEVNIPFH